MKRTKVLADSWDKNAGNWTRAVRDGLIPSRKAGTDDAIVRAIVSRKPSRILDVGCGEGWLIRRVSQSLKCAAVGIDGSAQLIENARQADPNSQYAVMTYATTTSCSPTSRRISRPRRRFQVSMSSLPDGRARRFSMSRASGHFRAIARCANTAAKSGTSNPHKPGSLDSDTAFAQCGQR
jgi:SAM-dependent methyltransferase